MSIDLLIIGAGSAGLAAAKRAAGLGKRVVLCDNDTIGGTCVSYGCVPKKCWHYVSQFMHQHQLAMHHGFSGPNPQFDWALIQPKLATYIQSLNQRHADKCRDLGVDIVHGTATFTSPNTVVINDQAFTPKTICISTGARALRLPIPGTELADTSTEFFSWQALPKTVVLIGGGYIAVELASILNALGADTHICIRSDQILRGFDADIQQQLHQSLIKRGIHIHTNHHPTQIESSQTVSPNGTSTNALPLTVHFDGSPSISADKIIQAIGRAPNTDALNCDVAGIQRAHSGAIIVNDTYQTSNPDVVAFGDCIDQQQLTPVAIAQARQWVDRFYSDRHFPFNPSLVPTAIFSHPEAASVGLTQADAEQITTITVKRLTFTPLAQALQPDAHKDPILMKVILDAADNTVLGIHMVGEGAAEIIQCLAVAVQKGITLQDLQATTALHPTIAEELVTLV